MGTITFASSHKKWIFGPNIGIFCQFDPMPDQKTSRICEMWVLKLLLPPVKIRIFGPERAKFSLKYAFIGTYRHCRFIQCTGGLLVGDCGARAVSRKTPISFIHFKIFHSEEFLGQDKKKGHFLSQMISSKIVFNCDVSTRRGAGGDKEVVNPVLERWTSPNTTIFSSSCS